MSLASSSSTKPYSTREIGIPVVQAVDQLQTSLLSLIDVLNQRVLQVVPFQSVDGGPSPISLHLDATERAGLARRLSDLLRELLGYIRSIQRSGFSRIDDEVDASYLLEMN